LNLSPLASLASPLLTKTFSPCACIFAAPLVLLACAWTMCSYRPRPSGITIHEALFPSAGLLSGNVFNGLFENFEAQEEVACWQRPRSQARICPANCACDCNWCSR
jgi:hypothetical protein